MKVTRRAEIALPPSRLLDALARSYEPEFILPPSVVSDAGRIVRQTNTSGISDPRSETIRIAPQAGGSVVEVTLETKVRSLLERVLFSARMKAFMEEQLDDVVARLRRGDLRPDAAELARDEARRRTLDEFRAKQEARVREDPDYAKRMAKLDAQINEQVEREPPTTTLEVLTLDGVSLYRNAKHP
jgi:hypothetical protein